MEYKRWARRSDRNPPRFYAVDRFHCEPTSIQSEQLQLADHFHLRRRLRTTCTVLLTILLAIKISAVLARGPAPIELDALGYWQLGERVLAGDGLLLSEPIAYRTPGYPYLIALLRGVAGQGALISIVALQGVLLLVSTLLSGVIAVRISKLPWAMPLTLAVSLPSVSALTYATTLLTESLFVCLLMVHLIAVLDYERYGTWGRAVGVGLTLALVLLTRPIALLLFVPHGLFLLAVHFRRWRMTRKVMTEGRIGIGTRVGHGLLAAVVTMVVVSPWLARNWHLFGSPQLTEFVGRNVWIVTFQAGSGAAFSLPQSAASERLQRSLGRVGAEDDWQQTWSVSTALVKSGQSDAGADRLMKQVAWDAIQGDPQRFTWKAFRRVCNFWRCAATDLPQPSTESNPVGQQTWHSQIPAIDWLLAHRVSQFVWINTLITVILGVATGLLIFNQPTRVYGLWLLMIFSYFAIVTGILEIPDYRYRMVVEPLMATTIGSAAAVALSWRRRPVTVEKAT